MTHGFKTKVTNCKVPLSHFDLYLDSMEKENNTYQAATQQQTVPKAVRKKGIGWRSFPTRLDSTEGSLST